MEEGQVPEPVQNTSASPSEQVPTQPVAYDLPKSIVVILVLLTVMISVLGTWSMMQEINNMKGAPVSTTSSTNGEVSITIAKPAEPQISQAHGKVSLTITEAQ
jgi:hypothetical protein